MQFCDFTNKAECYSKTKQASRGLSAADELLDSLLLLKRDRVGLNLVKSNKLTST